jgi:hypothetical protein
MRSDCIGLITCEARDRSRENSPASVQAFASRFATNLTASSEFNADLFRQGVSHQQIGLYFQKNQFDNLSTKFSFEKSTFTCLYDKCASVVSASPLPDASSPAEHIDINESIFYISYFAFALKAGTIVSHSKQ